MILYYDQLYFCVLCPLSPWKEEWSVISLSINADHLRKQPGRYQLTNMFQFQR